MKQYYSFRELVKNGVNFLDLLHLLIHSPTNESYSAAYVRLTKKENKNLIFGDGVVRLSKSTIQVIEMNLNKGQFHSEISLIHSTLKTNEGIWYRYLDEHDNVLFEEHITEQNLEPFLMWNPRQQSPTFESLEPRERFIISKKTFTRYMCDVKDIYIKGESDILKSILFPLKTSNNRSAAAGLFENLTDREKLLFTIRIRLDAGEYANKKSKPTRIFLIMKDLGFDVTEECNMVKYYAYMLNEESLEKNLKQMRARGAT